jgi:hypothetical protein
MGGYLIDSLPIKGNRTLKGNIAMGGPFRNLSLPGDQSGDGSQKCGFAGSIWADETDQFPCINTHAQIVDERGLIIPYR